MTMWQDIADALRDAIIRGDYPPGTTIPKETELMAAHSAGRETVRRAVIQLTAEGLVEPVRPARYGGPRSPCPQAHHPLPAHIPR